MSLQRLPAVLRSRLFPGILTASLVSASFAACAADRPQDYRLDVVDQPVAVGAHSEFDVKLTKTSTGQPVENAQITAGLLEMTMPHPPHKGTMPGGMSTEMTGDVKPMGSPAPGLYRLMGDISMPGTWKLDLTATVPGEPDAITGTTTFTARR